MTTTTEIGGIPFDFMERVLSTMTQDGDEPFYPGVGFASTYFRRLMQHVEKMGHVENFQMPLVINNTSEIQDIIDSIDSEKTYIVGGFPLRESYRDYQSLADREPMNTLNLRKALQGEESLNDLRSFISSEDHYRVAGSEMKEVLSWIDGPATADDLSFVRVDHSWGGNVLKALSLIQMQTRMLNGPYNDDEADVKVNGRALHRIVVDTLAELNSRDPLHTIDISTSGGLIEDRLQSTALSLEGLTASNDKNVADIGVNSSSLYRLAVDALREINYLKSKLDDIKHEEGAYRLIYRDSAYSIVRTESPDEPVIIFYNQDNPSQEESLILRDTAIETLNKMNEEKE